MESQGQKTSNNPKAMLSSLMIKRQKLQEELRTIEKQSEELASGREEGRSDVGPGRPRGGGGLSINGQGKPKRGRTGPRDGRKIRLSNDTDLDDEDDHDMGGMR